MELNKLENKIKDIFKENKKNNLLKKSTPTTPLNPREQKIYDNFIKNNNNNDLVYLTESGIGHTLYYLYKNNKDIYIIEIEGLSYESDFKISGIDKVWY